MLTYCCLSSYMLHVHSIRLLTECYISEHCSHLMVILVCVGVHVCVNSMVVAVVDDFSPYPYREQKERCCSNTKEASRQNSSKCCTSSVCVYM